MATPAGLAAVASLLLLAASASATIVPQRGMKGVRLDMTDRQVRDRLGRPDRIVFRRDQIIGRTKVYHYGRTTFLFTVERPRVLDIATTSPKERTSRGIGVGSSEAAVRAKVPRVRCKTEFGYHHCYVGTWLPGRRVTDFAISRTGRVKRVTIGFVID